MKLFRVLVAIFAIFISLHSTAQLELQTCVMDTLEAKMPWKWPAHNNWFFASNLFNGTVYNQATGATTNFGNAGNPISAY